MKKLSKLQRMKSVFERAKQDDNFFCACGNYYSSERCEAGDACDLGHRSEEDKHENHPSR